MEAECTVVSLTVHLPVNDTFNKHGKKVLDVLDANTLTGQ